MNRQTAVALTAGGLLGASCAMAVGRGSLWWLAPPAAAALLVLACSAPHWRRRAIQTLGAAAVIAVTLGALAYPQPVPGALNSLLVTVGAWALSAAVVGWRTALRLERDEARRARELAQALQEKRAAEIQEALLQQQVRLAEHMHDRIGHRLNYALLRIGSLTQRMDDPDATGELMQIRSDLAETLDDLGDIVALLDQDEPDHLLTIPEVLAAARSAGARITSVGDEPSAYPAKMQGVVAGVLAEAIANAARHAPGEEVTISLAHDPRTATVTVSNPTNGRGTAGAGTGLRRTRQRVELAGGRLDVIPGETFKISLQLPFAGSDATLEP